MSVYQTQVAMGNAYQYLAATGMTVCDARNYGLSLGQERGYDKLFFWDDDVIPRVPAFAIQRLSLALDTYPEIDIIGGVYPQRGVPDQQLPIVHKKFLEPSWWGFEDGKIHQVHMTGTGFTMFRASSLKKITDTITYELGDLRVTKYFDVNKDLRTDDFYFANIAEKHGLKWFVHGGVICDQISLEGELYKYENSKPPELVREHGIIGNETND